MFHPHSQYMDTDNRNLKQKFDKSFLHSYMFCKCGFTMRSINSLLYLFEKEMNNMCISSLTSNWGNVVHILTVSCNYKTSSDLTIWIT